MHAQLAHSHSMLAALCILARHLVSCLAVFLPVCLQSMVFLLNTSTLSSLAGATLHMAFITVLHTVRMPVLHTLPMLRRPTEIVKLPPVPQKLKRDPLGRNAAAAAASAAKAAKKNAKRAAARQRKLEQEQGMADGAPAAQAAPEAGSDAGESEDEEEEEWEVWDDGAQQESWLGVGGADRTVQAIDSSSGHEDDVGGFRQAWEGVDAAAAAVTSDVSGLTWGAAEFSSSPDDSPSSIAGGHLGAFSRHTPHEEAAPAHTYDPTARVGSTGQASYVPAAAAPAPTAYPAAGGYEQLNAGFSNLGTVTAAPPAAAVATYLQQQQQHVSQHSSGLSAVAAALQKSASGPEVAQHAAAQGYHLQAADTHSSTQQPAWLANTTPAAPPAAPSNMAACQPAMQYAAGQYNAAQQAPATATAAGTTGMCQPAHAAAALYQAPIAAVPQQQQQQGYGATYSTAGISSASRVHPYMHSACSNSGAHYPAATSTVPQASAASWAPQQQQYAATHAPAASTGVSLTQGYQASLPPASAACPATYPMETAAGSKQMPQQQYPGSQPVYGATGGVYGATWGAQAYVGAAATGRGAQDVEDDNLDDLLALLGVDM
jgi:hypothetical protein